MKAHHIITTIGISLLLIVAACTSDPIENPDQRDSTQTAAPGTYLNHAPDAQYVGKETCKTCHEDKYDTFSQSQMGRSWKLATLSNSDADFKDQKPIYDAHKDMYYLPFNRGENLYIREYRLDGQDTVFHREEMIDHIVGSGHHTNSHLMVEGGYLYQMPLTWYAQEQHWDLPPGYEDGANTRFERSIHLECITCHNALPDYVAESDNRYHSIPDGIDCERCHGPGSKHIEQMQLGNTVAVDREIDYSIVNPGKLDVDLQFDLCQRCHLQGTAVPVPGKTFADFKPGMRLADFLNVFLPRYEDSLNNFIMASHPDRLRMSACFQGSHSERAPATMEPMTCITCHNPHLPIETYGQEVYNAACTNCHLQDKGEDIALAAEQICSLDAEARSLEPQGCIGCHMPRVGASDIPHVSITEHYIRRPEQLSKQDADKKKAFFRLVCRTDAQATDITMARGYLSYFEQKEPQPYFLDSAAAYLQKEQPGAEYIEARVHLHYLQQDYLALSQYTDQQQIDQMMDPWTLYRIGEGYNNVGAKDKALKAYRRAVDLAPEHLHFRNKLAAAYMGQKQFAEASSLLDGILKDQERFGPALNNRGYLAILQGNYERAETDLVAALALDPDAQLPLANLASLYLNTGRQSMGKPLVKRLIKLDPENPNYRRLEEAMGS